MSSSDPNSPPDPNAPKPTNPSLPIVTDIPEQLPPDHAPTEEPK
jgi:hypothetical protein